jgi:hypothetical protein
MDNTTNKSKVTNASVIASLNPSDNRNEKIQKIETGVLTWEQQFFKTHGRHPTYSDMRAEFG